jgi:hypothetical protein
MKVLISIGSFVVGGTVGAVAAWKLLEKKYEKIANAEIESMRLAFERMDARAAFGRGSVKSTIAGDLIVEDTNENDSFRHIPPVAVRSSLDENPYERAKTKYNLSQRIEEEPVPEALVDDVLDRTKPYLIDDTQYAEDFDDHEKMTLVFYLDGVIMNEDDEMLEDVSNTIGDHAYHLLTQHPANMWVRNEVLLADYEIVVLHQAYGEQDSPSSESMRRRKANEEQ